MAKLTGQNDIEPETASANASYQVGYRKPPLGTRFRKGVSGNPRGRPKGVTHKPRAWHEETMKAIVTEEAYRMISLRDGARDIKLPVIQAIIRGIALNAAKGNHRSQRQFAALLEQIETDSRVKYDEYRKTVIDYKCDWEKELQRRKRLGVVLPDPMPHPDDILVDFKTGTIQMKGPMCKEEIPEWEWLRARKEESRSEIRYCEAMLKKKSNQKYRAQILDDLAHEKRILQKILTIVPD